MHYGLRQLVPPALEPVSLTTAKNHLVLDQSFTLDDSLVSIYLLAAREYAERYTNRVLIEQTLVMTLDHFPWRTASAGTSRNFTPAYAQFAPLYDSRAVVGMQINLPRSPVIAVQSISYLDGTLQSQTIPSDQYIVDATSEPARIIPIPGAIWPYQLNYIPGSVQVTFTAGYSRDITETLLVVNQIAIPSYPLTSIPTVKYTDSGTALTYVIGSDPAQGQFTFASGFGDGGFGEGGFGGGDISVNAADNGVSLDISYRTPNVPTTIQQAILLMAGSWYQTREGVSSMNLKNVPLGVDCLLSCNRLFLATLGN